MITTIAIFIAVFALLVLVHEAGHFFAAKKQGITVEEFGFGFPPRIAGKQWRGTLYSLNLLPLGGFVRLKGEDEAEDNDPGNFAVQPIARRALVIIAGVAMNVVLGWLLLTAGLTFGFPQVIDDTVPPERVHDRQLIVVEVVHDMPAAGALIVGDELTTVAGEQVVSVDDVAAALAPYAGQAVEVTFMRDGAHERALLTPQESETFGKVVLGVGLQPIGTVRYPIHEAVVKGAETTGRLLAAIIFAFYELIRDLITRGTVQADLAGPVGIAVLTGEVAARGITHLLQFAALLSLNLAILNILPIPALDGGRLLFLGIEWIRDRAVTPHMEGLIHRLGFVALLLLVIVITYKDIVRFFF